MCNVLINNQGCLKVIHKAKIKNKITINDEGYMSQLANYLTFS